MPVYTALSDQIIGVLRDAGRPLTTGQVAERLRSVIAGRQPSIDTVAARLGHLAADKRITRSATRPVTWSVER